MIKKNPYETYKQQSVMTMTPGDMLTAVYDGLLKQLNFAKISFEEPRNIVEINKSLKRAQEIIGYLRTTLDMNYPISTDLDALYEYFNHTLVQMNLKKDPNHLDDIITMVSELRETYIDADKKTRIHKEATG